MYSGFASLSKFFGFWVNFISAILMVKVFPFALIDSVWFVGSLVYWLRILVEKSKHLHTQSIRFKDG